VLWQQLLDGASNNKISSKQQQEAAAGIHTAAEQD
jgi:hypothetical protein